MCRKQPISALYFVIYIYFCSYNSRLAAPLDFCPVESTAHLRKASMAQPTLIDIDRILANKWAPRPVSFPVSSFATLKALCTKDWLNEFIAQEGEIQGVQWLEDCIRHLGLQIEVEGKENLPRMPMVVASPSFPITPSAVPTAWCSAPSRPPLQRAHLLSGQRPADESLRARAAHRAHQQGRPRRA